MEAEKAHRGNIDIDELKEKLDIDKAYKIMHRLTHCFTPGMSYLEASHVWYTSPWHAISGYADEFELPFTAINSMIEAEFRRESTSSSSAGPQAREEPRDELELTPDSEAQVRRCKLTPKVLSPKSKALARRSVSPPSKRAKREERAETTSDEPAHGVEDASCPSVIRKVTDNILIYDSKEKCHWCPTGVDKIDYLPAEERADVLDGLFQHRKQKNFLTYVLGEEKGPNIKKVRVNGKYWPQDTKIGIPEQLAVYRKTTLAKADDESSWEVIEDRVPSRSVTTLAKDKYVKCLIFLQEPRFWTNTETDEVTDVAFNAVQSFSVGDVIRDGTAEVTTLGRKQRRIVQAGIRDVKEQQRASYECVQSPGSPMKVATMMMMMICTSALATTAEAWPNITTHNVGCNMSGGCCDKDLKASLTRMRRASFFMFLGVCFKKHMFHASVGPLGLSLRPNLATARAREGQFPACFPCFLLFSLFRFVRWFSVVPSIPLGPKWHPKATVCSPMAASRPQNANKRYKDDTTNDETAKTTKRRRMTRQNDAAHR